MKFKFNALVAAVAFFAGGVACANPFQAGSNQGNSSAMFVAQSNDGLVSLTIDLNTTMTAFLKNNTALTTSAGNLSPDLTSASWTFNTNSFTINNVSQTTLGPATSVSWASPFASFFSNASVTGSGYQWGVIAADSINGNKSGTNVVTGQNLLFTQQKNVGIDFSGVLGSALNDGSGNMNTFLLAQNGQGTNTSTVRGGNVATAGDSFLGNALASNGIADFGTGALGANNFLVDAGQTAYFVWATANSNAPVVRALGGGDYPTSAAGFASYDAGGYAATFSFDGTTLTYGVPAIPEPETYAMLLVGLAAVFIGRRRALAR
jgi:hypothetical protein